MTKRSAGPSDVLLTSGWMWREYARGQLLVADTLIGALNERDKRLPQEREGEAFLDIGLLNSAGFHFGLALEMAAKGAIADRTGGIPPFHHRLAMLCSGAGLSLSGGEPELVARLEAAVKWWGRYVAPKDGALFPIGGVVRFVEDRVMLVRILARLGVRVGQPSSPPASSP